VCGSYNDFLDIGLLLTRKLLSQGVLSLRWNYHVESFRVTSWPGWSNICVTNDHGYASFVVIVIRSFDHAYFITGFIARDKDKWQKNDLLKTTQKTKYHTTRTPQKTRCLFMFTRWIIISCFTTVVLLQVQIRW